MGRELGWRRLLRLVLIAVAIPVSIATVFVAILWIRAFITPPIARRASIAFLISLEIGYAVVLPLLCFGTPICGAALYRARRHRTKAPLAARGLLLGICTLLAIGCAEIAVASWHAGDHRESQAVSSGGNPVGPQSAPALPEKFPQQTDPSHITLAVVGESSAFGMPFEKRMSVGKIVAWQLGQAIPARKFDVEMVAEPGDTMQRQQAKLAKMSRRPDAIIVYCGHNEFATDTPWTQRVDKYYVDDRPSLLSKADLLAARFSPVCGLIRSTADRFRAGVAPPINSRPPLVDAPAFTPAQYADRLSSYRRTVEAIVSYCERIEAIPILVVPPGNDAGYDPNRSFLPAQTKQAEREAFTREFLAASSLEESSPERAISRYRSFLTREPGFAETHYRLGRLLERAGNSGEAYNEFVMARDLDGFPMRCLTSFQDALREVAATHNCILVDGQELFHAIGPHGLLDDHLFIDAMHPALLGHVALAQGILDALAARRAFGWPSEKRSPRINVAACARHFGVQATDWKRMCEGGSMFQHATASLRHDPTQREAKKSAFSSAAKRLADGEAPERVGLPNIGIPPEPRGKNEPQESKS